MPAYHSAFDAGEYVTIADLETLQAFQQSWEWHHPLEDEQLAFAGTNDRIAGVSYYHGGTTLYEFAETPAIRSFVPAKASCSSVSGWCHSQDCWNARSVSMSAMVTYSPALNAE